MGRFLHRLGEAMFRFKWLVIASWVIIIGVLGFITFQVGSKTSSSLSIPGTSAQKALDRFNELFPTTGAQSVKVVVESPEGQTIEKYKSDITNLTSEIAKVNEVTTAVSPFDNASAISTNKTIGFISVQLKSENQSVSPTTISSIRELMARTGSVSGLTVEAGGDLVKKGPGELLGVGEITGVVVALIVLVVTLGSLIAAGMSIITAVVGIAVSMAGLFSLSHVVELNSTAPTLAVMLGLAVGIDYSLFIANRYRTLVKEGYTLKAAAGRAIGTAGNAVVFAATTVVIALVSLSVVQIPFMTVMGIAAAAAVAIAALVALTLVPAMLGIVGLFVFSRKSRKSIKKQLAEHHIQEEQVSHSTIWYKWGETLLKYRKLFLIGSILLVGIMAIPSWQLRLGLPTDEVAASASSERQAYELLVKGFGPGYNGPLLLVVEGLPAVTDADKAAVKQQLMIQYQSQPIIPANMTPAAQKTALDQLNTQAEKYAPYYQLQQVANHINGINGVSKAQAVLTIDDGTKGVIQVTPTTGPSEKATVDLVAYLRDQNNLSKLSNGNSKIMVAVTGTTAIQIDINDKLAAALPVYLVVVVGLSLIILMVAFRSVLVPLKATLGFLLSVFAMFGALVAVFQWGWFGITEAPGPIVSFIPIIAIGILFGLAMDYEFFLVSGMQEAYHKDGHAHKAVLQGFAVGSRVVVAAGLIMVAVFAGFIGNHDETIKSMGFALAIGILVDAFVVRMVITPIIMSYFDKAAWWLPKWLEKRLPNISIEGEEE